MNNEDTSVKIDLLDVYNSNEKMTKELAQKSRHIDVRYQPTRNTAHFVFKFTNNDAQLPSEAPSSEFLVSNSFVISTKDFCSPCYAGSIFYEQEMRIESEISDNGKIVHGFIRDRLFFVIA